MFGGSGNQMQEQYKPDAGEVELQHNFRDSISAIVMMQIQGPKEVCAIASWDG